VQEKVQTLSTRNIYPHARSFFVKAVLRRRLCISWRRGFPGFASQFKKWQVQLLFKKIRVCRTGNLQGHEPPDLQIARPRRRLHSSGKSNPSKKTKSWRDFSAERTGHWSKIRSLPQAAFQPLKIEAPDSFQERRRTSNNGSA
jgi:hypothetical protein